jgi:hypothetical protein
MSEPPAPRRSVTAVTHKSRTHFPQPRRAISLMKQAEKSLSPGEPALKQETYPIYELDWEKLKTFLEQRFQPLKFEECRNVSSSTITAASLMARYLTCGFWHAIFQLLGEQGSLFVPYTNFWFFNWC